ncbi:MAG: hypothetical protein U9N54_07285 [candidate division Zixibacteria bacterium]|nr:hypothetical protein [candidate division Zixibacteria bacterium]
MSKLMDSLHESLFDVKLWKIFYDSINREFSIISGTTQDIIE